MGPSSATYWAIFHVRTHVFELLFLSSSVVSCDYDDCCCAPCGVPRMHYVKQAFQLTTVVFSFCEVHKLLVAAEHQ
jgi:hypothetical protein